MSTKPHLVDPVHFFDERGHALSSYDVQETVIRQLREENARLRSNLAKINSILAKSKVANAAKSPPRRH
jgi:cell shape-determining protein MreC